MHLLSLWLFPLPIIHQGSIGYVYFSLSTLVKLCCPDDSLIVCPLALPSFLSPRLCSLPIFFVPLCLWGYYDSLYVLEMNLFIIQQYVLCKINFLQKCSSNWRLLIMFLNKLIFLLFLFLFCSLLYEDFVLPCHLYDVGDDLFSILCITLWLICPYILQ